MTKLKWPSCSPDVNPIEYLWDNIERRIRIRKIFLATQPALDKGGNVRQEDINILNYKHIMIVLIYNLTLH